MQEDTEKSSSKPLKVKPISEAAADEFQYIKKRKEGKIRSLRTEWPKFNSAGIDGLEWGSITVIGGLSGSGKTSLVNSLESGLFEHNKREDFVVLSFNFEMLARKLVGRKISRKMGKSMKQLYSADRFNKKSNIEQQELKEVAEYLKKDVSHLPIYYVDSPGTVAQIRETVLRFHRELGGKKILITLDHSILIRPSASGNNERDTLTEFAAMMNELKKKLTVSFMVLSQLNRDIESVERRNNPQFQFPQKKDIFGGDALFQMSDMVMVTHRPEMLGLTTYGPNNWPVEGHIYWHFLKVRDGEPFIAKMQNDLANNRIVEAPKYGDSNKNNDFWTNKEQEQ